MPQSLKRIQQNLKSIRKALKPFNVISQWVRTLRQQGNKNAAEKIFRLLIRLSKGRKASRTYLFRDSTERRESPLLILIQTTLKSEAYAEANFYFEQTLAYFHRELQSAPSDPRLLFEIGKTYLYWATSVYEEATHSHLEQSILYLEQALTANHNTSSDIHIQIIEELGESYFLNRMYKEALQLLEEAVANRVSSEKILLRLAALLEENGSYERALFVYDQALSLNPKSKASVLEHTRS
ncbi:tetratricopeptide repeat protein [Vampirovibrio chlorellavorus]|uniref:tetratricopeptide repeat protein n=1 Tax=Vampirovibrio chlorellavorus TaxID=758823 RepID=UPI0026EC1D4D|nr:tetratricopeptide repeat protein [Vampirovibrio chlorellavorus]